MDDARRAAGGLAALLAVFTAAFLLLVGDYGYGFDELIGDQVWGERTLRFLETGEGAWLDLYDPPPAPLRVEGRPELLADPAELEAPHVHGHLAALVASLGCRVLHEQLGWLAPVDAYHAANLLFGWLLLGALVGLVRRDLGAATAVLSVALLFAQPRMVAHTLANTKDLPQVALYAATLTALWRGWTERRRGLLLLAAALWGAGLSVKINAAFVPVIGGVWLLAASRGASREVALGPLRGADRLVGWRGALGLVAVAAASYVACWPLLWRHPEAFASHVEFIVGQGHTGTGTFDLAPLRDWLAATPEVVLLGLALGVLSGRRERDPRRRALLLLLVAWWLVPLVRANLPGFRHYDGIRHVLETTVPVAALAAHGWWSAALRLGARTPAARAVLPALVLVVAAWPLVALHPSELANFNAASGGLRGALARGHPDAGDYWAASYRRGTAWLNEHAPPGAVLAVPWAEHLVRWTRGSEGGLRADIELLPLTAPRSYLAADAWDVYAAALARGPVHVMFVTRLRTHNAVTRHALEHGTPVGPDAGRDGVAPVLQILRVDGGA